MQQNSIERRQEWFAFCFQTNLNFETRFDRFTQAICFTLAVCCTLTKKQIPAQKLIMLPPPCPRPPPHSPNHKSSFANHKSPNLLVYTISFARLKKTKSNNILIVPPNFFKYNYSVTKRNMSFSIIKHHPQLKQQYKHEAKRKYQIAVKIESMNLDSKWPQPSKRSRFMQLKNITKPITTKNGLVHENPQICRKPLRNARHMES